VLAEFIGVQMTRGVRYREMRAQHIKQNEDWLRERPAALESSAGLLRGRAPAKQCSSSC
jgi:hypothetical protein